MQFIFDSGCLMLMFKYLVFLTFGEFITLHAK